MCDSPKHEILYRLVILIKGSLFQLTGEEGEEGHAGKGDPAKHITYLDIDRIGGAKR